MTARKAQAETLFADPPQQTKVGDKITVARKKGAMRVAQVVTSAKKKTATPKAPGKAVAVHKPQAEQRPTSVLELCMMAARDKSIPTERVKAFLEIAREEERHEAEILFDEAMLAAQAEMPPVPRESYNKHTKSWWSRIEAVSAKVDPIARKHNFTLQYGIGDQRVEDHYHLFVDVTWNGRLSSGKKASFTKRFDADIGRDDKGPKGEGTKSLAQGSGSSITYGRRYLKLMVFDVNVLGMDRDGAPAGAEVCSSDEVKDVRKRLKAANIDEQVVCDVYKVDSIDHLMKADLPSVLQRVALKEGATS